MLRRAVRARADEDPVHGAAVCIRAAVLTTSPETIASPSAGRAPSETSASPVFTAVRKLQVLDGVADRDGGAHGALWIVLVRDRCAEDGHHRVADELLDRPAVSLDLVALRRVVGRKRRANVLGIESLRSSGEADEIREEDGHDLSLLARRLRGGKGRAPQAPQNRKVSGSS